MNNCDIQSNQMNGGGNYLEITKRVFHPIVYFSKAIENDSGNSILKVFQKSDKDSPYKDFVFSKKENYQHLPDGLDYYVSYFRMWPSQSGTRKFILSMQIQEGTDNNQDKGILRFEMPQIEGIIIQCIKDGQSMKLVEGEIKDVEILSSLKIELLVKQNVNRDKSAIDAFPMIIYAHSDDEEDVEIEVGRINLSIAPRDVFSKKEISLIKEYFEVEGGPNKTQNHDCITAVRVGLEKLLNANLKGAVKQNSFNMDDLKEYLDRKGFLCKSFSVDIGDKYGNILKTISDKNQVPSYLLKDSVSLEHGFHVFGIGLVAHTLTLIIDNCDIDNTTFCIYDQFSYAGRGKGKILAKELDYKKNINNSIYSEIIHWHNWTERYKGYRPKATAVLLKIQRAILLLGFLLYFCYDMSAQKIDIDTIQRHIVVNIQKQDSSFIDKIKDVIKCHNGYIDSEKQIDVSTMAMWLESDDIKNEDIAFFRHHFISGCQFFCDIKSTEQPMISIQKLVFHTEDATQRYAEYLKNEAFPLRKAQIINDTIMIIKKIGNNVCYSNSRIYISNKILYFLHCWDSCSLMFFRDIIKKIDKEIRVNDNITNLSSKNAGVTVMLPTKTIVGETKEDISVLYDNNVIRFQGTLDRQYNGLFL